MANNTELFECPICLQLLEDPVTTGCGHSYCKKCINTFWDVNNNRRRRYSCPQCRETFNRRPVLKKSALLANLLEEHKRKTSQSAAADTDVAPGDVSCDMCTGRKRKACKFCRVCLVSYCETHLQPHFDVPPLKRHSLIPASAGIKESICGRHDKLLEIYCHTDQQFICLTCAMDEHKGHDTVEVAAEKCEMQRKVEKSKQEIADRVLNTERKMEELRDAANSIRDAAWEACDNFERHISLFVRSAEEKCSEMREKVGEAEKAGVDWTYSHLGQLQREVFELKRREDKLNQLSLTEDPIHFLKGFQALGDLSAFPHSHERVDTLTEFVSAQKERLKNICHKEKNELLICLEQNKLIRLPKIPTMPEEIRSRRQLLTKCKNCKVEVDPHTVAACLCLSNNNREISWSDSGRSHPDHPHRFTFYHQALCKTGLKGSQYWEVEWDGGIIDVAVSYKGIKRKGSGKDCCFGHNTLSWKLTCSPSGCTFWHNNLHKGQIPPARSCRVGVHLDYSAGRLGFYNVSGSGGLTLLHQTQATFSEPVYPGFCVDLGATLKICNI
ncbi:E3 ubiquitin/ISG15 ligase TRIM25-like [Toxotes jaculatrix]|uniref:E3 ubiquitin/ISG15 ligase TRIM25-like n=1 Tax=Toxotes jaculatrix TaxID=941984 RepID=UPI001B3AC821|nr:E3 ubiquitin/ISG15 ligase TRIM25-like [Toxotes jaculatrix]